MWRMPEHKVALAGSFLWWGLIRQHDAFFKWVLDQPGVVAALLDYALPPELRRLWDGTAPVPLSGSLITREMEERRTDRSYRLPTPQGVSTPLLVTFEHKAAPDRGVGWQVTQYLYEQVRRWMNDRREIPGKQRHQLPVVAAVVVYHGKWRWRVPLTLVGAMSANGISSPYIPNYELILIDVLRTPIALLPPLPRLRVAFMIWQFDRRTPGDRGGNRAGDLKARLVELARAALALGIDDLTAMVYYLWGETSGQGTALLGEVLDEVVPGRREQIMQTAGDQLVAQGRALGLAEGKTLGLVEGKTLGRVEGEAKILLRQLHRRFGDIRAGVVERVRNASARQLEDWSERILDAGTLDDVFDTDRRP